YPESFFLGFKKEKLEGVKITMDPKKFSMVTDAMLKNWEKVKEYNTIATKLLVKESVQNDSLIIQSTNQLDEVNKVINILAKRLREWYELYNPEFSKSIQSHEKFAELILQKPKTELLASLGIKNELSMGADLKEKDINAIFALARQIESLFSLKNSQEKYLEALMDETCPNIKALAGPLIGSKLLALAGSLVKLAEIPSSTIQLLGAEKALFRHIRTGARPPKHGIIIEHPLVSQAKEKGKVARMLANKISLAAKVDLYKGEFVGDKMKKELEEKLK
ncbi:C/D box methylation guide ribonucleoprotein complex aNOP56 subunit, partial [Candidatus Woesearchaeota archaeon]|nr:C/D box methylation guide ribonucleoprotein complex aNOP56 subunit [Candidatus Woesearchaeota archaeon]